MMISFYGRSMYRTTVIFISFVIALFLTMLPLPYWAMWFRPEWTLLLLLYWIYRCPNQVGLFSAFVLGILLDCVYGSALGVHAIALLITAYAMLLSQRAMRVQGWLVQMIIVCMLAVSYQCIMLLINAFLKQQIPFFWAYWAPAFITALCWPCLSLLLDHQSNRFAHR